MVMMMRRIALIILSSLNWFIHRLRYSFQVAGKLTLSSVEDYNEVCNERCVMRGVVRGWSGAMALVFVWSNVSSCRGVKQVCVTMCGDIVAVMWRATSPITCMSLE